MIKTKSSVIAFCLFSIVLCLQGCAPPSRSDSALSNVFEPKDSAQHSPQAQSPEHSEEKQVNPGKEVGRFRSVATAYFPDSSALQGGYMDAAGRPLRTLQSFLAGKSAYVSVAMDLRVVPYGTLVRIPELEQTYNQGKPIKFAVVDTGGAFIGTQGRKIDICVASHSHAMDPRIGKRVMTVIVLDHKL